ncbi:MAG: DUF3310 domain-containing protein, partial [Silvanigrellaceae bacterium]|nr:DUF3310 domain-containing protein [Silvanigrellaceae bacterium]
MLNISYTSFPTHNIEEFSIESIDVIQDWNLNYDLSCVIKCIARAQHNGRILEDLKKAEWYLNRAYVKEKNFCLDKLNSHRVRFESVIYHPQTVCEDWKLTALICSTLINIFIYKQHFSHILKIRALHAALKY